MSDQIRGILLDVDGVLTYQGAVYPGVGQVLDGLRARGYRLCFVTNSTLKSRRSCAESLLQQGVYVSVAEIITASYATAYYLRQRKPGTCWVMLAGEGREEFTDIPQNEECPDVIAVGDYRDGFNFHNLNKALGLLAKGAKLIAMQQEIIDHSSGALELNVGSWVRLLERASGIKALVIGKPEPFIYQLACEILELPKRTLLMIGDQVDVDILGAIKYGIRAALVTTGAYQEGDLETGIRPDFIFEQLDEIIPFLDRRT